MQHLSEQEIVRREAMEQIRQLGIDPYPAKGFEVNFKSVDYTTADFNRQLLHSLEEISGIGTSPLPVNWPIF